MTRRRQELVITTVALMLVLTQVLMVAAMYVPNGPIGNFNTMRRSDSDEDDELDGRASAPYQNQGEGSGPANDGFDDNEQEGSYEETPRDEEGQADLERFFDDHLGASERDGMDKENLPTNLVPIVIEVPPPQSSLHFAHNGLGSKPQMSYVDHNPIMSPNNVETSYIKLPNKRLIITRQITRGPIYKGGLDDDNLPPIPSHILQLQGRHFNQDQAKDSQQSDKRQQASSRSDDGSDAKGSEIVRTEDDDMEPVYQTSMTNKPFKIDALGGFDPEEDFRDASRELNEPAKTNSASGNRRRSNEQDYQETKDISFNDPEADTLFNDASETDEVIFGPDPYQTDLEAEMSGQSPTEELDEGSDAATGANQPDEERSANEKATVQPISDDDSESNWVNDGVDDMDVPSQSYQDSVLEKAALNEAARRAAEEPAADEAGQQQQQEQEQQQQQPEPDQGDGENVRMPNADYLKNDLAGMDDLDDPVR